MMIKKKIVSLHPETKHLKLIAYETLITCSNNGNGLEHFGICTRSG